MFDRVKLGQVLQFRVYRWDVVRRWRLEGHIVAQAPLQVIRLCILKETGCASLYVVDMQDCQASSWVERLGGLCEADGRVEPVKGTRTDHGIEFHTRQRPRFKRTRLHLHVGKLLEVSACQ